MKGILSILLLASLLFAGLVYGQTDDGRKLELIVQTGHPVELPFQLIEIIF